MIPYLPPCVKVFWQISAPARGRGGICYNLFRLFSENPLLFRGKCAIISSVKNRMPRHLSYRGIAQLVEYWSPKPWVVGSSPSAPAKKKAIRVSGWLFSMKRALRRMKNEAGLRPMKRAFGSRRTLCALRFMATKLPLHKSHKAFASCSQSECFIKSLDFPAILWYNEDRKAVTK